MPAFTETSIANKAFVLLGSASRISSFAEASPLSNQVSEIWDMAVLSMLADHPWNFALRRRSIDRDPDWVPETLVAAYRFRLPNDCLRWLPADIEDEDYFEAQEEDGYLLTNEPGPVVVRYIFEQRDISRWSVQFVDALSFRLAYELAESVASSQSLRDRMEAKAQETLMKAKVADGLATGRTKRHALVNRSRFVRSRHRPTMAGYHG